MFRRSCPVPILALFLTLIGLPLHAEIPAEVIDQIKDEGLNRSQVMQTLSYMTDVIGPRLTNSPQMKRANEWTRDQLTKWGLYNAHLEPWGPFGRGWSLQRFSVQVVEPQAIPLIGYPKAWSPGLKRPITAPVVYVDARTEEDLQKYRGRLKGAIVLDGAVRELRAHFQPQGTRWTDEQLAQMEAGSNAPQRRRPDGPPARQAAPAGNPRAREQFMAQFQLASRKAQFYLDEGAAVVIDAGRGDGGTVFVQSASVPTPAARNQRPAGAPAASGQPAPGGPFPGGMRRPSPWSKDAPKMLPQITLAAEHFNRLVRMIQQGEKLKMAVDLQVRYHDDDLMGYNTVAEIQGSDLKDEVVMLGGHLDSWHSGTGTTDNAAGCAVAMEAVRILQALKLQPRRTIRIALWSGEEQGLLGSRAYVAEHFGSRTGGPEGGFGGGAAGAGQPAQITTKPDFEKFSAYFNLDNGTGKIRGIYCQGNEAVMPIFKEWLAPFKDLGASTVTIRNTGGTDHQSFDGIGLPGFQFIQDEIEYETRTHHSNMDVYDRAQEEDLKQAAVIMAAFVYNAAMRDEKLPRKPRP